MYEDSVIVMRCAVEITYGSSGGRIVSGIGSEAFLVYNGDGQVGGRDQTAWRHMDNTMICDVCVRERE